MHYLMYMNTHTNNETGGNEMKKQNGFTMGSGCYTCECCGKRTRDTGIGEADLEICADCYEIGGDHNHHTDNHDNGFDLDTGKAATDYMTGKACRFCQWEKDGKDVEFEMLKEANPNYKK